MPKRLVAMAFATAFSTCVALGDDGRWYDSEQGLSWGYTVTNGEATISTPGFWDSNARDICKGDIVVPARIGPDGPGGAVTYPVRDMKPGLFRNCKNVTSVRLPDGMRRVADSAFYFDSGSTITNVTVGSGCLDIGENAFCRCHSLATVNIPDTVTNIAMNAFTMCRALPRVDIPGSVKTIGNSAFSACSALEAATFGDGIEVIEDDAFMNCGMLASADLPSSVTSIGDRAFAGCSTLASVVLREGLESIGSAVFYSCKSLAAVSIPQSVTAVGENAFDLCPDALFDSASVSGVRVLSGWAVGADSPDGYIDLSGVRGIADGLFREQRNVTSVALPAGMASIPRYLFYGCLALEGANIPSTVGSIGDYAFASCSVLVAAGIPSAVTNIGEYAFAYCKKLKGVSLPGGLSTMGANAFEGCEDLTSLAVPASLKRIPMGAFENCTSLTNVTVEEGVEVIGNASFNRCIGLDSFAIPDSVKVVEDIAFGGCRFVDTNTIANVEIVDGWIVDASTENLTEVVVPGDVRGIANNAFDNCRKLTNAVVEAGVAKIPDYAFNCATTLADVSISGTVEEIGASAFCNCDSLVEAWVPSNVVTVGDGAFASCTALETVYLPVSLQGKVRESNLIDGSFNAVVRYYNPDGSLEPLPVPGPAPDPEVETRAVSFNPNGGEFDDARDALRDVEKGAAVGELPVPSRVGYGFAGWWTAKTKGTKITAKTKVTKNVTYYARWTVKKYKVSAAVSAKAAGSVSGAGTKAFNSKVTLKAAATKGYVFVKWENLDDPDTPWPSAEKCRQPSVTFKQGDGAVSVMAVFAKKAEDGAVSLAVGPDDVWHVDGDPGREISVVADSLSYPSVSVKGQPSGVGLVRVPDTDCEYVLKVTDASKTKPGVYTAKITAKNRAGKSVSKSVRIVAPNSSAAIDAGLISGLKTSTSDPYLVDGGMKTRWTPEDLGVEVFATNGWKLVSVTGLPTGLSWNGSAIVGAASKAGMYTVTFTMKKTTKNAKGKKVTLTSVATATFRVDALLPDELAGTYNGFGNASIETVGGDEENPVYAPMVDGFASAVKVTVTTAGKVTANVCGVSLSCNGFDSVSNGVYSVALKKTQKVAKGALKGKTKVWELHLDIAPDAAWDSSQLVGEFHTYMMELPSMSAPTLVLAQRNPFALADAKEVAAAVVASGKKGAKGFVVSKAYDEDYAYTLDCAECMVGGVKAAVTATAKASGTVALAGTIAKTKVSGSAVLDVSPEVEETYEDYDEFDNPINVSVLVRTATARFFTSKFVIEIVYTLEDGEVADVSGKVWKK